MVFKKPYAFFIKYFRLINLFLLFLNIILVYKLNLLHNVLNNIYLGRLTNFINMESKYIGFLMYLLIILIILLILVIILTLRKKHKPFRDYLYNLIYNIILIAYFLSVSNLFLDLNSTVIEQTTLKLYVDISFIIIFPIIYFLIKYLLIVIGFSINKFNFQKDIIELKQNEEDNEEVELIFDKNSYKTKRQLRKILREFKYYLLENKLIVSVIIFIVILVSSISLFSIKIFDKKDVSLGENFVAGNFSYKILNVYETKYDSRFKIIKDDSKFVIVEANVINNLNLGASIDFKRIRLFYGDKYVYANNFYNKYFLDYTPYDGEILKSRENNKFSFIFKVPSSYKINNYQLKFYDRIVYNEDESIGSYKKIEIHTTNLDKVINEDLLNLNENTIFDKKTLGDTNITINKYNLENSYTHNDNDNIIVIRDTNVNNILLIIDYKLYLDREKINNSEKDFFQNYVSIEYTINNILKTITNIKIIDSLENKIFISVPYNIKDSENINLIFNFRSKKIKYILK